MKILIKLLCPWLIICFIASACKHDPVTLPADESSCDSTNISFKNSVLPVLNRHCGSCHSSGIQTHGIILDNYQDVRIFALEGSLYGAIIQNGDYAPMPYDAPKLDTCSSAMIHHWIMEGIKNN